MPIYAYKCSSCSHELDVLQKVSAAPLSVCPACGAEALVKQLTAAGFQLKGSGWYVTDFKNRAGKADATKAAPENDGAAKTEPVADAKTDAKPAETATAAKDSGSTPAAASGAGGGAGS